MRSNYPALLVLAGLCTGLTGCGGAKSSSNSGTDGGPVPTGNMTIDLRVESIDPTTAVVRANLNDGRTFGKSYRLDGGDFFRACKSGVCSIMADNESVTSPDYIARFDYQPGVDYVVSFNRQQARNAPDSRVSMPPAFTIVTPANHQQVTDGDTVQLEWSPTGVPAEVNLSYGADCTMASGAHIFAAGGLDPDSNADGREAISVDQILSGAHTDATSPLTRCSIDLTVRHQLRGTIDPEFRGGSAVGIVSRQVNLDYIPR